MSTPKHHVEIRDGRHREPGTRHLGRGLIGTGLAVLVAGGLVGGAMLTTDTWASYQDQAKLASVYNGYFSAGIMDSANIFKPGDGGTSVVAFTGADAFVPDTTAIIPLSVANNSPTVGAIMSVAISPGEIPATVAGALRVSVDQTIDGVTTTMLGTPENPSASTATLDDLAAAHSAALAPRGTDPLASGATWTGPENSRSTLRVYLYLKDDPAFHTMTSVALDLSVAVTGASTND